MWKGKPICNRSFSSVVTRSLNCISVLCDEQQTRREIGMTDNEPLGGDHVNLKLKKRKKDEGEKKRLWEKLLFHLSCKNVWWLTMMECSSASSKNVWWKN